MDILKSARTVALYVIAVLVIGSTCAALAESYHGLTDWANGHLVGGNYAYLWPLMVDVFTVVGEVLLFVGLIDEWKEEDRRFAWALVSVGLAVSVAGNVGHVGVFATLPDRLTAAVPPIAAWAALAGALGALKRIVGNQPATASLVEPDPVDDELDDDDQDESDAGDLDTLRLVHLFGDDIQRGRVTGKNKIKKAMRCGYAKVDRYQEYMRTLIDQRGDLAALQAREQGPRGASLLSAIQAFN